MNCDLRECPSCGNDELVFFDFDRGKADFETVLCRQCDWVNR